MWRQGFGKIAAGICWHGAHRLRLVTDAAVAALAIEEGEVGEYPLGPAPRLKQREAAFDRRRLPHRPHLDMVGAPARRAELAPALVGILLMMRLRSEEHTSELQSLMRISYAVFCLKKKKYTSSLQSTTKLITELYNIVYSNLK